MYTVDVTCTFMHSWYMKDRCYIYIHALLVHERITMPTQTALRVRGDKAASLQLAEKV